jgi:hypothetical protein
MQYRTTISHIIYVVIGRRSPSPSQSIKVEKNKINSNGKIDDRKNSFLTEKKNYMTGKTVAQKKIMTEKNCCSKKKNFMTEKNCCAKKIIL